MKPLKPITLLTLGPLLLAGACAAAGAIVEPDLRTPRGIAIGASVGAGMGVLLFGAVVAGETSRPAFLRRHGRRLSGWTLLVGAMSLGHLVFQSLGDAGIVVAFLLLGASALVGVYLEQAAKGTFLNNLARGRGGWVG